MPLRWLTRWRSGSWRQGRASCGASACPNPAPGEILVETLASGVSRGTETLVFQGRVPESQRQIMRAPHQVGEFTFPLKYGYSSVGVVAAGPDDWLGRRVFCLHPHQDRYVVPRRAVVAVPAAVPDERAVLAANMETVVNASVGRARHGSATAWRWSERA